MLLYSSWFSTVQQPEQTISSKCNKCNVNSYWTFGPFYTLKQQNVSRTTNKINSRETFDYIVCMFYMGIVYDKMVVTIITMVKCTLMGGVCLLRLFYAPHSTWHTQFWIWPRMSHTEWLRLAGPTYRLLMKPRH